MDVPDFSLEFLPEVPLQTIGIDKTSFKEGKEYIWVRAVLRKDGIHLSGEARDEKLNLLYTMYDDKLSKTPIHWQTIGNAISRVIGETPKELLRSGPTKNP